MKGKLTLILILIYSISLGQNNQPHILIVDSIYQNQVVKGFSLSDGFGGYQIIVNLDSSFKLVDFSCTGSFTKDSGIWKIENKNVLIFTGLKEIMKFKVAKFNNSYYLFSPDKEDEFTKDVKIEWQGYSIGSNKQLDRERISYFIKHMLRKKYFAQYIKGSAAGV